MKFSATTIPYIESVKFNMDLKTSIRPLHLLYKILCLARFKISNNNIFEPTYSKIYIFQFLIIISVISYSAFYKFIYVDKLDFSNISYVSGYYYTSATILDVSVFVIYWGLSIKNEEKVCEIYNKIHNLKMVKNYDKLYKYVKMEIIFFTITLIVFSILSVKPSGFPNLFITWFITIIPFTRDLLIITQFGNLMLILKFHYESLDENFNLMLFKKYCLLYHKLFKVFKKVNLLFGPHILLSVILRVIWILSNGYDIIMTVTKNIRYNDVILEDLHVLVIWLILDIFLLLLIIGICNSVKLKAERYVKILSRFRIEQNSNEVSIYFFHIFNLPIKSRTFHLWLMLSNR